VTMPVALPANVVEFYVGATRMVAAIATLRGYDVTDAQVRTAVLLTLVGSDADEVLAKAGLTGGTGKVVALVGQQLPPAALLMVNKAIGFRLLRGLGEKAFARLGRGIPLAGGVVGGGIDVWMMKRIADHALTEFPQLDRPPRVVRSSGSENTRSGGRPDRWRATSALHQRELDQTSTTSTTMKTRTAAAAQRCRPKPWVRRCCSRARSPARRALRISRASDTR
jgi:hypothetical protein